VQLLALALYARDGRRRDVRFQPGKLNIVTGESKTGKSALLTITEYCLGRDRNLVPAGPITSTVAWYAALWQLPGGGRAFVARPAPRPGAASTQRAMLEFGNESLDLFAVEELEVNADSNAIREQLGRRIGIVENLVEPAGGSSRSAYEAHLGHAAWLCFQDQDEIANRVHLFHRQGEDGHSQALKDTIPYFLGAVPADQASKRADLREAQRTLRRIHSALSDAERTATEVDTTLRGLLAEAHAAGLTEAHDLTGRDDIVDVLRATRHLTDGRSPTRGEHVDEGPSDAQIQDRRRALEAERDRLRSELVDVMADRELLLDHEDGESDFALAVALHTGRLTSLDLLPLPPEPGPETQPDPESGTEAGAGNGAANAPNEGTDPQVTGEGGATHPGDAAAEGASDGPSSREGEPRVGDGHDGDETCPVCGSQLAQPDPTVSAIGVRLNELRAQLANLTAAPASRRTARQALESRAEELRRDISASEVTLSGLSSATKTAPARDAIAARNFTRGLIDAMLETVATTGDVAVRRLRSQVASVTQRVERLEEELDGDNEREQLTSRLLLIGRDMTEYANRLGLEHAAESVRLDLANLTVVTDTVDGPIPLARIGSAANWIGYHMVTHLALHRYFVRQKRPVPRFLMFDQPTQAYYPSEASKRSGLPASDRDQQAVLAMFQIMRDVVSELAPAMQIIVCDHADLPVDWFQDAIEHYWRDGVTLIPVEWLTERETLEGSADNDAIDGTVDTGKAS
jgi:hypothetical protein